MEPSCLTVIVAIVFPEDLSSARHLTPAGAAGESVAVGSRISCLPSHFAVGTMPLAPSPRVCSTPVTCPTAHSFASPTSSPTLADAAARSRTPKNCGIATAERMPMIATTIISSIRVKPWAKPLRPLSAIRRLISSFCCIRRLELVMGPWVEFMQYRRCVLIGPQESAEIFLTLC